MICGVFQDLVAHQRDVYVFRDTLKYLEIHLSSFRGNPMLPYISFYLKYYVSKCGFFLPIQHRELTIYLSYIKTLHYLTSAF